MAATHHQTAFEERDLEEEDEEDWDEEFDEEDFDEEDFDEGKCPCHNVLAVGKLGRRAGHSCRTSTH